MPAGDPAIVFAYANERNSGYLKYLDEEIVRVRRIVNILAIQGICDHISLYPATPETIPEAIIDEQNGRHIIIFHYSGHADNTLLKLNTLGGENTYTDINGIAELLGALSQTHLKLVFLNGCSTLPQVEVLIENGVKAVIATSTSIDDSLASKFSIKYYESFVKGKSIKESFDNAISAVSLLNNRITNKMIRVSRGVRGGLVTQEESAPWSLFVNKDYESVLDYRLNVPYPQNIRTRINSLQKYFCDRSQQHSKFLKFYSQKDKFQFFVVHGQEREQPLSLSERLSIEHVTNKDRVLGNSYHTRCVNLSKVKNWEEGKALLIYELFKQMEVPNYVALDQKEGYTLENLCKSPKIKSEKKVTISIKIYANHWRIPVTQKLLHWFVSAYCQEGMLPQGAPNFIFFINVIYSDENTDVNLLDRIGLFLLKYKIKHSFKSFCREDQKKTVSHGLEDQPLSVVLPELTLVDREDVKNWMDEYLKNIDAVEREELYNKYFGGQKPKFFMKQVAEKLDKIVNEYNQKLYT